MISSFIFILIYIFNILYLYVSMYCYDCVFSLNSSHSSLALSSSEHILSYSAVSSFIFALSLYIFSSDKRPSVSVFLVSSISMLASSSFILFFCSLMIFLFCFYFFCCFSIAVLVIVCCWSSESLSFSDIFSM